MQNGTCAKTFGALFRALSFVHERGEMRRLRVAAKDEGAGTDCRNRVKINKARIEKTIPYSPLRLTPSSRLDRVEGYGEGVGLSAV